MVVLFGIIYIYSCDNFIVKNVTILFKKIF